MVTIQLDIAQTIGIAAILLVVGEFIKKRVNVLARYFIPGPIIGGLVFSVIALVGHQTGLFAFEFYDNMRAFLLLVFFTTIGFSASFELLKKGGVGVALFLAAAVGLVVLQNLLGAQRGRVHLAHGRAWHIGGVWTAAGAGGRRWCAARCHCGGHLRPGVRLRDWRAAGHAAHAPQRFAPHRGSRGREA